MSKNSVLKKYELYIDETILSDIHIKLIQVYEFWESCILLMIQNNQPVGGSETGLLIIQILKQTVFNYPEKDIHKLISSVERQPFKLKGSVYQWLGIFLIQYPHIMKNCKPVRHFSHNTNCWYCLNRLIFVHSFIEKQHNMNYTP